jgi:hypothetical protein
MYLQLYLPSALNISKTNNPYTNSTLGTVGGVGANKTNIDNLLRRIE